MKITSEHPWLARDKSMLMSWTMSQTLSVRQTSLSLSVTRLLQNQKIWLTIFSCRYNACVHDSQSDIQIIIIKIITTNDGQLHIFILKLSQSPPSDPFPHQRNAALGNINYNTQEVMCATSMVMTHTGIQLQVCWQILNVGNGMIHVLL